MAHEGQGPHVVREHRRGDLAVLHEPDNVLISFVCCPEGLRRYPDNGDAVDHLQARCHGPPQPVIIASKCTLDASGTIDGGQRRKPQHYL